MFKGIHIIFVGESAKSAKKCDAVHKTTNKFPLIAHKSQHLKANQVKAFCALATLAMPLIDLDWVVYPTSLA
ncbi:hypothetical protein [Alteromonas sp. D210916BOD_24]|uniref:hypothetical protein n=1 Tax=Alteromonas sp. D210916BOD_24 TaxID=3157618 RepID=UPI00399C53F6